MKIKETLTQEDFELIHQLVNKVKRGTKNVTLPIEAVKNLLEDHGTLHAIVEKL